MTTARRIRVLHVVDRLARGGTETWLLGVLRRIDRARFDVDVMVHTGEPQPYDDAVRQTGSRILPCLAPAQPVRYLRSFTRIMRQHGPYDIVHCHMHGWNGVVLSLARRAGVPVRVPHSRVAKACPDEHNHLLRRSYFAVMRKLILRHATAGLAVSSEAAAGLFGPRWQQDGRFGLLRSAIDPTPYTDATPLDQQTLPPLLQDPSRPLAASIARFDPQKNPRFIAAIIDALAQRIPRAVFALIGEGTQSPELRAMFSPSCVDRVALLGSRGDVPALLRQRVGVLLLPSLYEGLPRVAIEAQFAGVPILLSDSITRETQVVDQLVHWQSLRDPPSTWAATAQDVLVAPRLDRSVALATMLASDFNLDRNVRTLESLYERWTAAVTEGS